MWNSFGIIFRTTFGIISSMIQHFNIWKNVRLPSCTLPNVQCLQRESNAGRMVSQSLHLELPHHGRPAWDLLEERRVEVVHFSTRSQGATKQTNNKTGDQKGDSEVRVVQPDIFDMVRSWHMALVVLWNAPTKPTEPTPQRSPKIPKAQHHCCLVQGVSLLVPWQQHNTQISRLAGQLKWHHRLQEWHAKSIKKEKK